jgi:hypothetical protein
MWGCKKIFLVKVATEISPVASEVKTEICFSVVTVLQPTFTSCSQSSLNFSVANGSELWKNFGCVPWYFLVLWFYFTEYERYKDRLMCLLLAFVRNEMKEYYSCMLGSTHQYWDNMFSFQKTGRKEKKPTNQLGWQNKSIRNSPNRPKLKSLGAFKWKRTSVQEVNLSVGN